MSETETKSLDEAVEDFLALLDGQGRVEFNGQQIDAGGGYDQDSYDRAIAAMRDAVGDERPEGAGPIEPEDTPTEEDENIISAEDPLDWERRGHTIVSEGEPSAAEEPREGEESQSEEFVETRRDFAIEADESVAEGQDKHEEAQESDK
jgi:hypothetical protein